MSEITDKYKTQIDFMVAYINKLNFEVLTAWEYLENSKRAECLETMGSLYSALEAAQDYLEKAQRICDPRGKKKKGKG